MDEAVRQYYRRLLDTGFRHAGAMENPSITLDYDNTTGHLCGKIGDELHISISIRDGRINDLKYICICEAIVNVVVEAMCSIAKGMYLIEAKNIDIEAFSTAVGSRDVEFLKKAKIAVGLLSQGIPQYESEHLTGARE